MTAEGGGVWLRLGAVVVKPLLGTLCIWDRRGFDHLPATGGLIVAANHICPADGLVLGVALHDAGRLPRLLTKAELFEVPLVGRFIRGSGQIPVHRERARRRRAGGSGDGPGRRGVRGWCSRREPTP